ncbi:Retrotransposon-like protein [Zea mays]|uniref:Retrotransposon-like protein n=1 Tax=Zea mays TaxID=4577 RepID=A0A1D6Q7H7_MAIZE|nr:Retrotransposon-like protein [Zea mays]
MDIITMHATPHQLYLMQKQGVYFYPILRNEYNCTRIKHALSSYSHIAMRTLRSRFRKNDQRIAKERLTEHADEEFIIRIIGAKEGDPVQYDMPTTDDLAMLLIGDFSLETFKRDIIIETRNSELKRISALHPAYMALQYPLLFPYGERGFQIGVMYSGIQNRQANSRVHMTMQDYYCYQFHYKPGQPNQFLSYGILSNQAKVDARACIDENRLTYILNNQDKLRIENLQGISDAVSKGCINSEEMGKTIVLPASHIGGRRYMIQNYHDSIVICRVHGPPDFFVTFTCNAKWPEIIESLYHCGQKNSDAPDIAIRIFHMKLQELLQDIKSGNLFGPCKAELDPKSTNAAIRVRIIRKWEFRGATNDGPLRHVNLILADEQTQYKCVTPNVGEAYLSATAACTWYFNPDIPEAQVYYSKLLNTKLQMIRPQATEKELQASQTLNIEDKTIEELLQLDPDMFPEHGFKCTVTISRLVQDGRWWFPSCIKCNKSSSQTSTGYQCTSCNGTETGFRYKLNFIATDGTSEAEFFCFDSIAKRIVGKSCQTLFSTSDVSRGPPPDLAAIISLKFTFVVTINMSAFSVTNRVFSILSVLTSHGRQASIPCATQNLSQQQMLTQDNIIDVTTTQESPATSIAKLSTSTKQESVPRRRLTYSEMLQDTNVDEQVSAELNEDSLASPPKKIKSTQLGSTYPDNLNH